MNSYSMLHHFHCCLIQMVKFIKCGKFLSYSVYRYNQSEIVSTVISILCSLNVLWPIGALPLQIITIAWVPFSNLVLSEINIGKRSQFTILMWGLLKVMNMDYLILRIKIAPSVEKGHILIRILVILRIKIAPSVKKGHILIRILVTVSICKGLRRIWCGSHADTAVYFLILMKWQYGFRKRKYTAISARWLPHHILFTTTDGDIVNKICTA